MAIIRSGVLGNTRGKVAGVVGSQWKDKNYLREYVKPANPNTAAQQAQRGKMSDCVEFAKALVGSVFNAYTDKFQKSMSGFNYFIKQNIAEFDGSPDYSAVKLTEGKLYIPSSFTAEYTTGTGACVCAFASSLGNNGATDDKFFAAVYYPTDDIWFFAPAEVDRSTGTITVTCYTGYTPTDLEAYLWCAKYSGTIVSMISNSVHDVPAAP